MTPKSRRASNGRTSANSTIVWPSELRSLCGVLSVFISGVCCVVFGGWAPGDRSPPTREVVLLDCVGDPVQDRRDVAGENSEDEQDGGGDHAQDHGVLRHGLTLLPVEP